MIWAGFLVLIASVIALDLGVFHRKPRIPSLREALGWTAVWVLLAMLFNVGVFYLYELNPRGWDMDTAPVQKAIAEFGRRQKAQGNMRCANLLLSVAERLRLVVTNSDRVQKRDIDSIISYAETEANKLMQLASNTR